MKKLIIFIATLLFSTSLFAMESCIDMGCFCDKKGISPQCYKEPYKCCPGKAPQVEEPSEIDELADLLKTCVKKGDVILCKDGKYVKKTNTEKDLIPFLNGASNQVGEMQDIDPDYVVDSKRTDFFDATGPATSPSSGGSSSEK